MESFTYGYPVKVYFGEKAAEKNLSAELAKEKMLVFIYRADCSGSIKERKVEKREICEFGKHGY